MSIKNIDDVERWIEANVELSDEGTPRESALWWAACREAEYILETCRTKDLAHILLDGVPRMDEAAVNNYIDTVIEDCKESCHNANEELVADLKRFFGC